MQPSPAQPPSVPPPSYPPPPSATGQFDRTSAVPAGWRPADDDDSAAAVAWRARTGLRRADRALSTLETLNENVARLNATIEGWSETWGRHWRTLGRIAWSVGIPLLVAALLAAGAWAWHWVSTLHH